MFFEILRLVFRLALNLFFRDIKVRGFHNVPNDGPVIFATAPHSNQFVDPLMLVITCGRKVGFLTAKKSMDLFWIGMFARWLNSIPVERPQDLVKKASGTIYSDDSNPLIIRGIDTKFKSFGSRTTITLPKEAGEAVIQEIISDTEVLLSKPFTADEAVTTLLTNVNGEGKRIGTSFKIIPYVDQTKMFEAVVGRLSKGQVVGIFPEGGSHDRPEMLPLKAGVAIMALETLVKFPGTRLKIVPTGLHYFNSDKFRSRAVIEYGEPIEIPIELVDQFKRGGVDKRQAIALLLDTIQIRLKELSLQAPDFETLMVAQASRRLYQTEKIDADSALILSRRFAMAYEKFKDDPAVQQLTQEVLKYNRMLKFYGVQDHQVKNTHIHVRTAIFLTIYRTLEASFFLIMSLPVLVLMSPLFYITRRVSHQKMRAAKAGSKVKIIGKDVVTTWKLLTAVVVAPLLWLFYTFLIFSYFYYVSGYNSGFWAAIAFFICWPILSTMTVYMSDLAYDIAKSIRPLIVAIGNVLSSSEPLREMRADLQGKIRNLVDKLGPEAFLDFDHARIVRPSENSSAYNQTAAEKLGRGKFDAQQLDIFNTDVLNQINTVFGQEMDRVDLGF